jgi:protein O-mannosyl-transferase
MTLRRPRKIEWYGAGIFLIAAFCYWNTLLHGFVSDDNYLILNHPYTKRVADWPRIFTAGHYEGSGGYRPLTTISFALNYFFGGANPFGYHLTNIALHALNSALVLLLFDRFLRSRRAAVVGALIFAIHPIHTEAVAWISGRAELLATAFFLLAWLFHLRSRYTTSILSRPRIFSWLAFFAALLSKENALIFPVAIFLGDILISRWQSHWDAFTNLSWTEKWKRLYLPNLAVVAFYFLFRSVLYQQTILRKVSQIAFVDNPLVVASFLSRVFTAIKVQGEYLWLLIWPAKLCGDYSFNTVPVVTNVSDPWLMLTLVVLGALLVLAAYSFHRVGRIWFGIAFYGVAILPIANLLTLIGTMKAERLLYLPSFGFCLAAGLVWNEIYTRFKQRIGRGRLMQTVAFIALIGILSIAAWRTWERNKIWRSESSFWRDTAAVAPENIKAQLNHGHDVLMAGRNDEAIDAFRRARRIDPNSEDAMINLGAALMQNGQNDEAASLYEEAVRRDPERAAFHLDLGLAYLASGKPASGVRELQRAGQLEPDNAVMRFNLGLALSKTGDAEGAVREYRRAIESKPDYAEAWNALGAVLLKLRRVDEARNALRTALEIKPGYSDAIYNMTLLDSFR